MKKINLAVIFGGKSGEHEVSLASVKSVFEVLDKEKYNVILIAITKKGDWLVGEKGRQYFEDNVKFAGKEGAISLDQSQKLVNEENESILDCLKSDENKIDLALPILHGPFGEDGKLQGFLDTLGIPYVFSGVLAHALAMNKKVAKLVVGAQGVPVCRGVSLLKGDDDTSDLNYPLIVKPIELGSSVGVSKVNDEEEFRASLENAWQYGKEALVEEYKKGREFTVTVLERNGQREVLAITEIIPLISEFYDYKAKYEDGGSRHVCPAEISEELSAELKRYAIKVFESLGCRDLARVDFIYSEEEKTPYFIEINTIPGMTKTSLAPEAAKVAGIEFGELLDILIDNGMRRK